MLTPLKARHHSACYDKQYVSVYLQLFYAKRANSDKITIFRGTAVFDARLRRLF